MDKLRIFNQALGIFNIEPLEEQELTDTTRPEVAILEMNLNTAIRKASREMDWSFLEEELTLGEDHGSKGGFAHSFELPEGLFRITSADAPLYRRVGNLLLIDSETTVYGIMEEPTGDDIPGDYWDLVAYALAFFASSKLSPGDDKTRNAMLNYNTILQSMVANECQCASRARTDT